MKNIWILLLVQKYSVFDRLIDKMILKLSTIQNGNWFCRSLVECVNLFQLVEYGRALNDRPKAYVFFVQIGLGLEGHVELWLICMRTWISHAYHATALVFYRKRLVGELNIVKFDLLLI